MNSSNEKGRLWQLPFTLLFSSKTLQDLAHGFASISFVWLLIESGGNALSTSILFFCALIPQMLLSSFVSPLLTRGRLQQWMFASDAIRVGAVIIVPICYFLDALPLWVFFASALVQSSVGALYTPASVTLLPRVVAREQLQSANAFLQSSSQIVVIMGLAAAGAVIELFSASITLIITSSLFFLSAILIIFVRDQHAEMQKAEPVDKQPYRQQIKEGFSIVRRHKLLYGLNLFAIFLNVGAAPFMALAPIFVTEHLNGDAATLTMIRTSVAIGALIMGLLLAKITIKRQGALFTIAGITSGFSFVAMGLTDHFWLILIACFINGLSLSAINVPELVIVQTSVPQHQQAQVFSVLMTFSFLLLPFASVAAGQLATWIGPANVIAIGGAITLLSGVMVLIFTPLARLKVDVPEPPAPESAASAV